MNINVIIGIIMILSFVGLVWYCVTELGSIAENAALMGAPVPAWLLKLLEAGKKAAEEAGKALPRWAFRITCM